MLYPLSYEGGAWLKPSLEPRCKGRCNPRCNEALSGRPTVTGYWTRATVSRMAAASRTTRTISVT